MAHFFFSGRHFPTPAFAFICHLVDVSLVGVYIYIYHHVRRYVIMPGCVYELATFNRPLTRHLSKRKPKEQK